MRNKGFFWFLTILLTAVCVYQLSFSYVASGVETDAEARAKDEVFELERDALKGNGIGLLPNGTKVDFKNDPEAKEKAKAAFINEILKAEGEKEVYPVIGSTYQEVKARSLAFGLDLVGGMSVTLEISVPDLVKSYARNARSTSFKFPFEKALYIHQNNGGEFIGLFRSQYEKMNPNRNMVKDFDVSEIAELSTTSSNSEVVSFLRKKASSSMDGVEQIMQKRINQFGVAQPNIQKDNNANRLYIELPGVQDEATVKKKLVATANLQFFETYTYEQIVPMLTRANAVSMQAEVALDTTTVADDSDTTALSVADSLAKAKADSTKKAKEVKPLTLGGNQKSLLTYLKDGSYSHIGTVFPKDKAAVSEILGRDDVMAEFPKDLYFMWSANPEEVGKTKEEKYALYAIKLPDGGKAEVGGKDISFATKSRDQQSGEITVDLTMTSEGSDKWAAMTERNVGAPIAITMDSVVYSCPRVMNAITKGNTQITGDFSIAEAEDLAGLLNGGALPAPCVIKESTKVGPTIGDENREAGLTSFLIAFLAVFIYMYFYYGRGGLVANIALTANVILIFGCLASFGAVLTLAGIAGIVLTIGTAVDANILIFERIREEQYRGADQASAVSVGFQKALPSIIDANVTHLLVAIILKVFGTGEIESFATTLIIGIFTSVFSAIVISKLIITSRLEKGKETTFMTKMSKGLFQNLHFDWVGKRKYFYFFSIAITILGIISLATRSLNPSVEFTGGRTNTVKFDRKADLDGLRVELEKVFAADKKSNVELKTKSNDYNVEIITNYKLADDGADEEVKAMLLDVLKKHEAKFGKAEITESRSISASVSSELWRSAAISIGLSLVAIFAYILIRFGQWQYSIGAIVGLAHDVLVVLTVFSLLHGILPFSLDINQAFIAAVLTVIGYSMNDTVIVFDRIRENLNANKGTQDHGAIINGALNTTLSRTFNTSMILFVVLLVMFIFGGPAIKGFLFALLVGVVIGTYSSLCVATPILIDFNKRFIVKKNND